MTTLEKLVVTTACNALQWVIDNNPAQQTDAKLRELRASLNEDKEHLKEVVAANQE